MNLSARPAPIPRVTSNGKGRHHSRATQVDAEAGKLMRLRRLQLGLSQTELGDKLGVAFQQIQKYELGHNRLSASRLHQAATALGVPINYFFSGVAAETAENAPDLGHLLSDRHAMELLVAFAVLPEGSRGVAVNIIQAISSCLSAAAAGTPSPQGSRPADGASVLQAAPHLARHAPRDGGRR